MKTFTCSICGYRFEKKDRKTRHYCPYCGNKKIEEEKRAEEIVE